MTLSIRVAEEEDLAGVLALYRAVAERPGGLARLAAEIDEDYVGSFMRHARCRGLELLAVDDAGAVVGEIHAARPGIYCFSHVLNDLTIAVHPDCQGTGVGRRLFAAFMDRVVRDMPDILRVELIARESNARAIGFYESLGFAAEGRLRGRIRTVDGRFEDDVVMGWLREHSEQERE